MPTPAPQLSTPAPIATPAPAPSAFANTNVFVYGSPPPNTFAAEADAPQIFFAQFSPTVLKSGTPVQIYAITTTNVKRMTLGYPGYSVNLSQVAPSKWQAAYDFNASGLSSAVSPTQLTLSAYGALGGAATIQIPISLLSPTLSAGQQ